MQREVVYVNWRVTYTQNATDEAPQNAKLPRLSSTMRQSLIQSRISHKLSQSDLAKKINAKPQIIQELESGKAISENEKSILQKLQRVLGVALSFDK
jgi:ribosome-binding protein aMBF1 (putative translation factor)